MSNNKACSDENLVGASFSRVIVGQKIHKHHKNSHILTIPTSKQFQTIGAALSSKVQCLCMCAFGQKYMCLWLVVAFCR
jgi:predicted GNAT superfamily acetyltransferase